MNVDISFQKKQLASFVREGDFSHPGEEDAIELAFEYLNKHPMQNILDVGCGLGGTANYIKLKKYGNPVGIDINPNNINYAKDKYPNIEFHLHDAAQANNLFTNKFDVFWLFSSFLLFADQIESLSSLSKIAHSRSQLLIFDYTLLKQDVCDILINKTYNPIQLDSIKSTLAKSGWNLNAFVDISTEFLKWYTNFTNRIVQQKNSLINKFGIDAYNNFYATYSCYMNFYQINALGGCILIADKF